MFVNCSMTAVVMFIMIPTQNGMLISIFPKLPEVSYYELRLKRTSCRVPDGNEVLVLTLILPGLLVSIPCDPANNNILLPVAKCSVI